MFYLRIIFLIFFFNFKSEFKIKLLYKQNKKLIKNSIIGLISLIIINKIKNKYIEISKEKKFFNKEEIFKFLNESYEKINECKNVTEDEKNYALITILNFSLPVLYINDKNYNDVFEINAEDIWINLTKNNNINTILKSDLNKNNNINNNYKEFITNLINKNEYLYSIHFQDKNSYKDKSFNFFMNKIFKKTFEELKITYNSFLKKNKLDLFVKYCFTSPDHCFPYRRRHLIDGLQLIQDNGLQDFKACFKDDLEIKPVVICKFKQYNDNEKLKETKIVDKITEDFINDLIELSNVSDGNFQNYTNNNFKKEEEEEDCKIIKFSIKFLDEKKEKIGYINTTNRKIEKKNKNSKNFEYNSDDFTEKDFKSKIKSIIDEYKNLLKEDDSIKIDEIEFNKQIDKNQENQRNSLNLKNKQEFKTKIYNELNLINENNQSSKKFKPDLIKEVEKSNLLNQNEKNELIEDINK